MKRLAMACPIGTIAAPAIRTGTKSRRQITKQIAKGVFTMPVAPAFVGVDQEIL